LSDGYSPSPALQESIERVTMDWFNRGDGFAHRRIAEAIQEFLPRRRNVDEKRCLRYLYGVGVDQRSGTRPQALFRRVRHVLGLSPDWSFRAFRSVPSTYWATTNKYFGVEVIRDLLGRIARADHGGSANGKSVTAEYARERGDYSRAYYGQSVTLSQGAQ